MRFEALNKLWERARRSNHDFRASTQIFPSLDPGRIARDMELVRLAEERGHQDEPPSEVTGLDEVELAVIERIETDKKEAHQLFEDQLQTFSERLTNLDFDGQFGMIRQANLTTVTDYVAVCESGLNELHGIRRDLADAEAERDSFRRHHRLTRAARVQSTGVWWMKVLFLLLCVLIETILNGSFLSEGSEQGLVGGTTLAIGFAVLNIGLASIAAPLVKLALHRSFLLKLVGIIAAPAYAATAILINLALAHYRETSEVLFGEAGREVVKRMLEAPFSLTDIDSWILFGVGLFFSLAAHVDTWLLSDPYPGYAGVESRLKKRRKDYVDTHSSLLEELRDVRDENTSKIDEIIRDLSGRKREYDAIIEHRGRISKLFEQHQNQLEHTANALLSIYREKNRKSRSTKPPSHFAETYKLGRIHPPQAVVGELNDAELADSIRKAREQLMQQQQNIAEEFKKVVAQYPNLDTLHPDQSNGQTQTAPQPI